ncbi:MAG: hypothetical protein HY574_03315 [candidate division NC10 bacterium]|nr:hypothetical protein [candidate division NC10 bacterium]
MEDFVALSPLSLFLNVLVHFLNSIQVRAVSIRADHGPRLLPDGPASGMERRGWLATLCFNKEQSVPDLVRVW